MDYQVSDSGIRFLCRPDAALADQFTEKGHSEILTQSVRWEARSHF